MKAEVNETGALGIAKRTLFQNAGGQNRERQHGHGHEMIRSIGDSAWQPTIQRGAADEPSEISAGTTTALSGGEEVLNAVIVIAIIIVGRSKCQEAAVGPEDSGSEAHGESRYSHAHGSQDADLHHEHHGRAR